MLRLAAALTTGALLAGLASAATVTGTPRADVLRGTPRADVLDGRAGNDTLLGLSGADVMVGGPGRDTIAGGKGDDRVPAHGDGTRDRIGCGAGRDIVTSDTADVVQRDCEVVSRQISSDRTSDPIGQHATQAEPDTFAFGSTIVSVFQNGRTFGGGAVAIGFSTSTDGGATWRTGLLPGVSDSSPRPGPSERASDPVVAYDAAHRVWLAATLGISERTSSFYLYVNRSPDGLTWSDPVAAVTGPTGDLDKEWITCDNGTASPFRGNCYLSYFHVGSRELRTTTTRDGGLTWSTPVANSPIPPRRGRLQRRAADRTAERPARRRLLGLRRPEREHPRRCPGHAIEGRRSIVLRARRESRSSRPRTFPRYERFALASAEVDGSGRAFVVWEGCPGGGACSASRIVMSTSVDGVTWTPAQAVTTGSQAVDHFLPGIGANPAATGRLALVYHSIPDDCANVPTCPGIDVFHTRSTDGGRTWSRQQRLTAEPIELDSIARTRLGLMLADYVSTSFVRGRPVSVFMLASPRISGRFRQATFAYR